MKVEIEKCSSILTVVQAQNPQLVVNWHPSDFVGAFFKFISPSLAQWVRVFLASMMAKETLKTDSPLSVAIAGTMNQERAESNQLHPLSMATNWLAVQSGKFTLLIKLTI